MGTALILTTFNRPSYLFQCLSSLQRLVENPDMLIIVDDCSTDPMTLRAIEQFTLTGVHIIRLGKSANRGIKHSLLMGIDLAFTAGADLVINLDGDAVVTPDFVTRLKELHAGHSGYIVSGFNSMNRDKNGDRRNPIISDGDGCWLKSHANGINMCFNEMQYLNRIRPSLLRSTGNWDFDCTSGGPFVVARPSVVDHIGYSSSMGHGSAEDMDVAWDFPRLKLPSVTLIGADSYFPEGLLAASEVCQRHIEFGAVKMLTEPLFSGREAYSKFCLTEMYKYVDTEHFLIIHPDSMVVNPWAWDDKWLQYSLIGADWPWLPERESCGNGGFSLRSRKMMEYVATLKLDRYHEEDVVLCELRPHLEEKGFKFAPRSECRKFSMEAWGWDYMEAGRNYAGQFGYHGSNIVGVPVGPFVK